MKVLAVWSRELAAYRDAPATWIAAALVVAGLHAAYFFLGYPVGELALPGLWEGGAASLGALFAWLPLVFVVLAPALTMASWAEERRAGTDELLLTWPLRTRSAVLGKFLAAWSAMALVTLAACLPAGLLAASLGPLDWGTLAGGLVGAILLAASCTAIGSLASACTQEGLLAFVLGAALLGLLWSAGPLVRILPPTLASIAHWASPYTHFLESAASGVLDLRDLVYHATLTSAALVLAGLVVEARRWR